VNAPTRTDVAGYLWIRVKITAAAGAISMTAATVPNNVVTKNGKLSFQQKSSGGTSNSALHKLFDHPVKLFRFLHQRIVPGVFEDFEPRLRDMPDHLFCHRDVGDEVMPP